MGRLTSAAIGTTQYGYSYDLNGNRTEKRTGTAVTTHTHDPNSNRLLNVAGNLNGSYSYDAAGNVVNAGANVYNNAGRIQRSKSGAVWWDYRYNALGQRVKKTDNASNTTLFIYDQQGQLQGEYDSTGQARLDTIWLENIPVAVVQAATPAPKLYYAWSDHLGSPRQLSNPADNKIVWEWAISEPFGHSTANADPDGDGQQLVYNLRFPGQYFDAETGRYYNYFRDYDPRIGRYIQSDPIGLAGGINTYGYVGGGPLSYVDPYGKNAALAVVAPALLVGTACLLAQGCADVVKSALQSAISGGRNEIDPIAEYGNGNGAAPDPCAILPALCKDGSGDPLQGCEEKWHEGSYGSSRQSLVDHFKRHGKEVNASTPEQYLRKAEEFSRNLRGAQTRNVNGPTEGVVRHMKNGRYVDIARDGRIISYGLR